MGGEDVLALFPDKDNVMIYDELILSTLVS